MRLVILALVLCLSLPIWILAAGDRTTARRFGAVLAALCAVELLLALQWIAPGERITLTVLLLFAVPTTLFLGMITDAKTDGDPRRWSTLGLVMSAVYSCLLLLAGIGALLLYGINGAVPQVPSAAMVLPLPPGISIGSNVSDGCGDGSQILCTREIYLAGGSGLSQDAIVQKVAGSLAADGWQLTGDPMEGWSGCRSTGILLDRGSVCVEDGVTVQGKAYIELDWGGSGW